MQESQLKILKIILLLYLNQNNNLQMFHDEILDVFYGRTRWWTIFKWIGSKSNIQMLQ